MPFALDLAYGHETLPFGFAQPPEVIQVNDPVPTIDAPQLRQRLLRFVEEAHLDVSRPAIVVADKTRLCGYPHYLPVLLDALTLRGAPEGRTIFIAYGTHSRQTDAECRQAYGAAYDRFRWVHHSCDAAGFVELGRTRLGTPVRLPSDILSASCVITFGAISHHYFAGFGGGRKLIFPGLGERAAIYANHGLFLDRARRRLADGCRAGRLAGNPLAEDLAEVETFRPADMEVHAILDSRGRVCDLLVGRGHAHFQAACRRHGDHCEVGGGPFDRVLAACGGAPKDINFIQSHKAIHNAAAFVADGGRLIVLARCPDGIGSTTFLPWFAMGGWPAAFDRLAQGYVGNGGTALAMMAKTQRIRIALVTDLEEAPVAAIGCEKISVDQARQAVAGAGGRWAVIPNASLLVRRQGD
ncbi:MAG: lactate racemase domain-containing protein [Desulfatitalea sp.]